MRSLAVLCIVLLACFACFGASQPVASVVSPAGALIDGTRVPSGSTVFKGDTVQGSATLAFSKGANLIVFGDGQVRLTDSGSVELMKGMSRVQGNAGSLILVASNWSVRSTPDATTGRITADVVRSSNGTVSINVKEGLVTAERGRTREVASAGHPVLLPDTDPQAGPPPAPPTTGGTHTSAKTIGAYAIGVAALAMGAAVLATRDTGVSKSDFAALQAQNAQLASQLATLSTQNTALQAQVTSLQATVTKVQGQLAAQGAFNSQVQALLVQATALLSQVQSLQSQLAAVQTQINALIQQVANGTPLTAAQVTQLNSLVAQQTSLSSQIAGLTNQAASLVNQANNLPKPNLSPSTP